MDAKIYLRYPTTLLGNIVILQERIDNLRENMLPKGVRYDRDKVQTSPEDPMTIFAVKIDELEHELLDMKTKYDKALAEISTTISKVDNDDAKTILAKRYIGGKRWRTIEDEEYISESQLFRFHRIGIKSVQKILNEQDQKT